MTSDTNLRSNKFIMTEKKNKSTRLGAIYKESFALIEIELDNEDINWLGKQYSCQKQGSSCSEKSEAPLYRLFYHF